MVTTESVLEDINKNGFVVLDGLFKGDELDELEEAANWFMDNSPGWYRHDVDDQNNFAIISPLNVPEAEMSRVEKFHDVFSRPLFANTVRKYLHKAAFVDRIFVHRAFANPNPVTEWHADQQRDGRESFKFMLYLCDVDAKNGAFSYVPGSHRFVKKVVVGAETGDISNTEVHNFEQVKRLARDLNLTDCIEAFDEISEHIQGDYDSDDAYSLTASRGSVIMFDTKGMHRGGVPTEAERFITRIHCFEPAKSTPKGLLGRLLGGKKPERSFFSIGPHTD